MRNNTHALVLVSLFAALTAVGAFLKFPLGVSSITLQFFFTAMAGVLLGPKYGALSQGVYVLLGLIGLPVFTQGGGLGYLVNPTCGFLFGLIACAWVIGKLAGGSGDFKRVFLAATAGLGVLYLIGIPYLYLVLNLYLGRTMKLWETLKVGMFLFLPGDFFKITVLAFLAKPLMRARPLF